MTSPALRHKIAKMRMAAPAELPKARICTAVVLSATTGREDELQAALAQLKASVGLNWTLTHALQFMSGRQADFCVDVAEKGEREGMYLAHLIAKSVCQAADLSAVPQVDSVDVAKLRAIACERQFHDADNAQPLR